MIFRLDPNGKETVLHNFAQGTDGAWPVAGLINDAEGNLYGTASYGNAYSYGVVFEINPSSVMTAHDVFPQVAQGEWPMAGLVRDSEGNLYGTTVNGGTNGDGVVFKLDMTGHETVLHSFTGGLDGAHPLAGLLLDSNGNLYGTTYRGGDLSCKGSAGFGCGVVFKITP